MKKFCKNGLLLLVVIILVCTVFTLMACVQDTKKPTPGPSDTSDNVDYTITVQRSTGRAFPGATILLYPKDGSRPYFGTADSNGTAVINAPKDDYTVKFTGIVTGYKEDDNYTLSADETTKTFKLDAELIKTPATKETTYQIGSVMNDFSFTDIFGYEYTLSDLLKTKKAVLLNFWYIGCYWCNVEFPEMVKAHERYADDIAIVAFDTDNRDTLEQVTNYATSNNLTNFQVVHSSQSASGALFRAFGFSGNPATVLIDRQGVACFVESGALGESSFVELFERYSKEPYDPYIYFPDENRTEKPDIVAPSVEEVANTINADGVNVTYSFIDDEYNWPWIIDGDSIKTSNSNKDSSYSIINANVSIPKGQCLAFDYKLSTESNADYFFVHVNDVLIHQFCGLVDEWTTCYAYVPENENEEYKISFSYGKDDSKSPENDYVSIKNVRLVSAESIDSRTEIIYRASSGARLENKYSHYIEPVYNSEDGYYHVGSENGPLLLADLMNENTAWSNSNAWSYVEASGLVYDLDKDGIEEDYTNSFTMYAQIANNSPRYGFLAVTEDIKTHLMALTQKYSNAHEKEWLELCSYIVVYGAENEVLQDPAVGLGYYNAFDAVLSESSDNQVYNTVIKNQVIMPRGIYFKFVPSETAIYKINSVGSKDTFCFLYDYNLNLITQNDDDEDNPGVFDGNFVIKTKLEKGNTYYLGLDFNMVEETGTFDFVINKLATTGNLWVHASGADYTTILDDEGHIVDVVVGGAVDYELGEDGVYHVKNEDGTLGSKIYIDMTHYSYIFPNNTMKEVVDMTCYYCKTCGTKYYGSVEYFEKQTNPFCAVCYYSGKSNFEKRNMFALPTPVRDENGSIMVMIFEHTDDNGSVNPVYVPMYELNTSEKINYNDPTSYLEDLHTYGIKFTDYSEVMQKYVELSETQGHYPELEEAEGASSRVGYIEATEELVDILNKFIVFGDYSISVSIDNAWLMMSYYYLHLA